MPTSLPLLGPELDRLLAGDLLAALEQRRLAGDQLAAGELQRLGEAGVADRAEVQHLAAFAQPAVLRGERRALILLVGMHRALSPDGAARRYGCNSPPPPQCSAHLH